MIRTSTYPLLLAASLAIVVGILLIPTDAGQPPKTGPATEKRFPPLKVPPGFKATLFACDPLIEYPSVIAAGPKPGALFVAIDYMTGLGTDGKVKSEIRLVEDTDGDGYADKATVVAKGFNSIQGLAYHDGTLFVMHAPFLSAVPYPSPPAPLPEREDLLTGLGLPPEKNPSRLHCANGVVVGHDGWLYLALGDNGVNVLRPEGDRLIHHGGAILRCRPDGRDLHVFSTGLRNIYDIALDAELNVFTRDNENDGGTYMIRVCHSFFGADHGYPYHYEERKDEAMPPIGDFGLGSSAGGVCYLETQFPPEYRGNLFFCEWGKSVVRYELHRAGSGFAPVKELEFAAGDSKDPYPFKPTDIVVQRDGTMMVSDYADGQRPKRGRGRIYHIAYVGQDSPVAKKPASKLDSESYYDRWEAQAAIERSGKKPAFDTLGPRGRIHAIWALAKIDGPKAIGELLLIARTDIARPDPEPRVRAQAIRAIADLADPVLVSHRLDGGDDAKVHQQASDLAEQIAIISRGQDPRVELEAVIALGRLRWTAAPDWMLKTYAKPDAALSHAWMQTLRRSGWWPGVMNIVDKGNPVHRKIAMNALAEQYVPFVVDGLIKRLEEEKNATHRREYAELLARVYKKQGAWKYWGYRPGPRPANTEAWEKTEAIAKALDEVLADADFDVRLAALKSMMREKAPIAALRLTNWLDQDRDAQRVAALLAALAAQAQPPSNAFRNVVLTGEHSNANRLAALALFLKHSPRPANGLRIFVKELEDGPMLAEALRRYGKEPEGDAALVASWLKSADGEVRAAAIEALGTMNAPIKDADMRSAFVDKDVRVRRAAAGAAGKLLVKSAVEPLLKLAADPDAGVRLGCLESLRRLKEPRVAPLAVAALTEPALELKALECLGELGGPAQMKAVTEFARRNPSTDGTIAAVRALTTWRERMGSTEVQRRELDRAVAEIHGATGIVARWRVSGALDMDSADKISSSALAKEGVVPADWRSVFGTGADGRVLAAAKTPRPGLSWLAAADVVAADKLEVEFLASSRGSLQVWLNGSSIHQRGQARKFQTDSDRFAGTLAQGANRLLVMLGSADDAVEFHLRFRRKSAKAEHEKLTQAALNRAGIAERGRKIFLDKDKSLCLKCHQLAGQGERIGPELTGVGARFSRIYLVESILEPSRTIAPSFETLVVTLKNGKIVNGVKVAETERLLVLADNQGQKHELARADIEERQPSALSTMPDGLEQRFTEDEFVDLIAFLASQKERAAK